MTDPSVAAADRSACASERGPSRVRPMPPRRCPPPGSCDAYRRRRTVLRPPKVSSNVGRRLDRPSGLRRCVRAKVPADTRVRYAGRSDDAVRCSHGFVAAGFRHRPFLSLPFSSLVSLSVSLSTPVSRLWSAFVRSLKLASID